MGKELSRTIELGHKVINSKYRDEDAYHQFNAYLSGLMKKLEIPENIKHHVVNVQYNKVTTVEDALPKVISWLEVTNN